MAAILNLGHRMKFYKSVGSSNGISIQNTYKRRNHRALDRDDQYISDKSFDFNGKSGRGRFNDLQNGGTGCENLYPGIFSYLNPQ